MSTTTAAERADTMRRLLRFAFVLNEAKAAAEAARCPDTGTCNFDSPAFDYRANGFTRDQAAAAIEAAGLRFFDWKCFGIHHLVISGYSAGQAQCHTAMAEAAQRYITDHGYPCAMYYQTD